MEVTTKDIMTGFDVVIIISMLVAVAMSMGYYTPETPMSIDEVRGMSMISLGGVCYLMMHKLIKED